MKHTVRHILNQIQQEKVNRRNMRMALLVLSIFVVTGVLWQLTLTGITMTAEALCGHLAHTHTEQCLETTMVCQEEEAPGHSHNDDCYAPAAPESTGEDAQSAAEPALICQQAESAGHSHSDTCYENRYICGFNAEHTHSPQCYSDTDADLETSADWEATLPGLSGNSGSDLVAVAASQLGYTESILNYKIADDGITQKGYTRYGEWYGNPYGDWNAMFVSFCLRYADHPAYETLKSSGAEAMRLAAENAGLYRSASGTVPSKADLVFLDKNRNGVCDAAAIVSSCQESGITVVEGDCDAAVVRSQYALDHPAILGYALLTPQPDTEDNSDSRKLTLTKNAGNSENNGAPASELPAEDGTITVTFVVANANYTNDPGNHTTHLTVNSTEDFTTDGTLSFTPWEGTDKYTVTGTGTLDVFMLSPGTSFAGSGYSFPAVTVENISPEVDRQHTYVSMYNWVTDAGMICNNKTVFTQDTTLFLHLYDQGTTCGLNWVCNCDNGGSHSITFSVSGFGSPVFTWNQSLSSPYIPTAAAVNSMYKPSAYCTVGSKNGMEFKGWYVKDTGGNEIDFTAGMPILESYKDPNSDGYSVKIYARWEEAAEETETVAATFVNGQETTTVSLNKGQALGENLPAVTAPEGKVFVGWQIGDTTAYATAETVIETDTVYTAVFASSVTVTFMHDGMQYGEPVTVPEGALLWNYLPAEEPAYSGDKEMPMVFAGWQIGDTYILVTEQTTAQADMVLHAVFEETIGYAVYLHDMAPDGVTDYEKDGQDVEISQAYLFDGMTLAEEFSANPYTMVHDGVPASECVWYLMDSSKNYIPYDLTAPVTSDLHLYTFHYSVTLTREEVKTRSSFLNLFPVASAAEIAVNGNTLTLTLREGEKPTAADFVVGGEDYTLYNWTYINAAGEPQSLEIDDIIAEGVTGNITAASSSNDLSINAYTNTQHIYFYVIADEMRKLVTETDITVYSFGTNDSKGRWRISQAVLESVYRDYGLKVNSGDQYKFAFCSGTNPDARIWNDVPLYETNGMQFIGLESTTSSDVYFYYLPNASGPASTSGSSVYWYNYKSSDTFYSVTVEDPKNLVYSSAEELPPIRYVLTGGELTVTLADPAEDSDIVWQLNNTDMTGGIPNGDGTTTYTINSVTEPIVLTPAYKGWSTANKHINLYVYVDNERKTVASGTYPVHTFEGRHYVSASLLEQIYSEYGFAAGQLTDDTQRYFPHTGAGDNTVWSDAPSKQLGDTWFSPIVATNGPANCDVYYAPGYTRAGSAHESLLRQKYSFYTVTVRDPKHLVYGTGDTLPSDQLVYSGSDVVVTVKAPSALENPTIEGEAYEWLDKGNALTNAVDNSDGTITYTIENVTKPIALTPELNVVTVCAEDPEQLIYQQDEELPKLQILKGQTAVITVKTSPEYRWLVNGESIEGGVYNNENTHITYTFADVTEDITLVPVQLLDSISITYNINLPHTPTSTAPMIKDGTTYMDSYHGGEYTVLTPSCSRYTIHGDSALQTVVFKGWKIDGTDIILTDGRILTAEELSQYGESITLNAVWETLDKTHSVSFYINLELQVANYENSTAATPSENYTSALFGTEVKIEECPLCDEGLVFDNAKIIEGPSASATASTDAHIRQLTSGVSASYMEAERVFSLGSFPDDGQMLSRIAAEQASMIAAFKQSYSYDEADPTNVTNYRRESGNKIICASDSNGDLHYIPAEELTPENYTIRWYVFKYDGTDGWHIDGVLVKKQAQLTVTKTFYGDDAAVNAVKQGYTIDVVGINEQNPGNMDGRPTLYTLTLNSSAAQQNDPDTAQRELGYTSYNARTDTYTWVVNLTADWDAWLYEQNHTSSTSDIVTLSEYTSYNFTRNEYNQGRTTYTDSNGVRVAVKAHGIDQDYRTFETVSFYNTYLPSAAVPISKIDENGKPLTGVTFTLQGSNQNGSVAAKLWKDAENVYHYRPNSVQEPLDPSWVEVDCIAVDEMGYATVMGLKDKDLNYSFELIENSTPEGYNSVGIPIGFTIDADGSIRLTETAQNSDMVHTPDNYTIHVTNTSQLMSVTAKKNWEDNTNQKVTLQLMLDDIPIPGKVVELDGTADTPEGVTDGYEASPWTVTWNNLPAYTGGTQAVYRIKETHINGTPYDPGYGDGYADYQVIVEDMKITESNGNIPTAAEITVTNRKQLSGLEFTKTNALGEKLPGAVFQLYRDEGCTIPYGNSQTSDNSGIVRFGDLAAGIYYMKEIQAPEGYLLSDSDIYTITVHAGKTTISAFGSETAITQIINDFQTATLHLQKVDKENHPLSGAIFKIWKKGAASGKYDEIISREIDGTSTTVFAVDAAGELSISGLTRGDYKLIEFSAPDGYYRMTDEIYFTIDKGKVVCSSNSKLWSFDGTTITVINVPGSELPQTGGIGTHYGTMVGLLMIAGSLLYGFLPRRKRERGTD